MSLQIGWLFWQRSLAPHHHDTAVVPNHSSSSPSNCCSKTSHTHTHTHTHTQLWFFCFLFCFFCSSSSSQKIKHQKLNKSVGFRKNTQTLTFSSCSFRQFISLLHQKQMRRDNDIIRSQRKKIILMCLWAFSNPSPQKKTKTTLSFITLFHCLASGRRLLISFSALTSAADGALSFAFAVSSPSSFGSSFSSSSSSCCSSVASSFAASTADADADAAADSDSEREADADGNAFFAPPRFAALAAAACSSVS